VDLRLGAHYDELRERVREFARANWPLRGAEAELPRREQEILFRRRAIEAGLLARTVPRAYGGAEVPTDPIAEAVIRQELDAAGAPHRASPQGTHMLVPTLLEEGSEAQKRHYIPPTLVGEIYWCQGYSEPGAGSDLASLQSRAVAHGDHFVITGQKIWTSNAFEADMMFGLFRTEADEPRSGGLSYLLVDMKSPGIDVRPLRQMNGGEEFCEVFFDEVRVPIENLVGRRGEGWKVSKATLKHERMLIGDASYARIHFQNLLDLARRVRHGGRPAIEDPGIRRRLAELEGWIACQVHASQRILSAVARNEDLEVLPDMLMAKLNSTNVFQRMTRMALDLLGEEALTEPSPDETGMAVGTPTPGRWVSQAMVAIGTAIAGGTSNIQRNIIGERVLGLPRDPRPPGSAGGART